MLIITIRNMAQNSQNVLNIAIARIWTTMQTALSNIHCRSVASGQERNSCQLAQMDAKEVALRKTNGCI